MLECNNCKLLYLCLYQIPTSYYCPSGASGGLQARRKSHSRETARERILHIYSHYYGMRCWYPLSHAKLVDAACIIMEMLVARETSDHEKVKYGKVARDVRIILEEDEGIQCLLIF